MSADRADAPASGEGTRRRGTRGGRGRQRASDAPESGETLNDPRIAGRRPARPSKAEAEAESPPAAEERAPRGRRAAAATEEAAAEPATAEAEPEKKAAPRRRASTRKSSAASTDDAQGAAALAEEVRALREALTAQSQA
ncbi:MAG: hypothetical protein OXI03_04305, partial [Chloroflexota bacterium]|nr:hypothetical protein [Chloroflexota bacterium]